MTKGVDEQRNANSDTVDTTTTTAPRSSATRTSLKKGSLEFESQPLLPITVA